MKNFFLLFLVLTLVGCDILTKEEDDIIEINTTVHNVIIESSEEGVLSLTAKTGWYNGCGKFSHYFSYENEDNIFFEIYCSQPKSATCTESPISIDVPIQVKTSLIGEINLKFLSDGHSTFDTVITINN